MSKHICLVAALLLPFSVLPTISAQSARHRSRARTVNYRRVVVRTVDRYYPVYVTQPVPVPAYSYISVPEPISYRRPVATPASAKYAPTDVHEFEATRAIGSPISPEFFDRLH